MKVLREYISGLCSFDALCRGMCDKSHNLDDVESICHEMSSNIDRTLERIHQQQRRLRDVQEWLQGEYRQENP